MGMRPGLIPVPVFRLARIQARTATGLYFLLTADSTGTAPSDQVLAVPRLRKWWVLGEPHDGFNNSTFFGVGLLREVLIPGSTLNLDVTDSYPEGDHSSSSSMAISQGLEYALTRGLLVVSEVGSKASQDSAYTWNDSGLAGLCTPVFQPSDGSLILGTLDGHIWYSQGLHQSFVDRTPLGLGSAVHFLSVDPANSQRWIAGLDNGAVCQTMSAGLAWLPATNPSVAGGQPSTSKIVGVGCGPNPNQTYAAQDHTLWSSLNGWHSAQAALQTQTPITCLDTRKVISVGCENGQVQTLAGLTLQVHRAAIAAIARPQAGNVEWFFTASVNGEIAAVHSDGQVDTRGQLPGDMLSLAVDPESPIVLWAGTSQGCYVSPDAGATWLQLNAPAGALGLQFVGTARGG